MLKFRKCNFLSTTTHILSWSNFKLMILCILSRVSVLRLVWLNETENISITPTLIASRLLLNYSQRKPKKMDLISSKIFMKIQFSILNLNLRYYLFGIIKIHFLYKKNITKYHPITKCKTEKWNETRYTGKQNQSKFKNRSCFLNYNIVSKNFFFLDFFNQIDV